MKKLIDKLLYHNSDSENDHHTRYQKLYPILYAFAALLIVTGFLFDPPDVIGRGLFTIITTESSLIMDYVALAGPGAAFVNAGIVTLLAVALLDFVKEPPNGLTVVTIGLMSGFSLFGKNFLNIWPILFGTFIYSQLQNEPFRKYAILGLSTTALTPIVSFIALNDSFGNIWVSLAAGILIGIIVTPLAAYTFQIQNGMNLYNTGFACGLIAMMFVPLMHKMGADSQVYSMWATGYNVPFATFIFALCITLILIGFFAFPLPTWAAWAGYRRILQTSGRSPSDYLRMFGPAPVLINTGINGIMATMVLLMIEGDLNGPTIAGIFSIMGFSSFGKHIVNMIPVMMGVAFSTALGQWGFANEGTQMAILFCTTLAPISGYFGWVYGVIAGFLHSAVVLSTSLPVAGMNLYNNGFSAGLVAIFIYPIILAIVRHRKAEVQNEDYFDAVQRDDPIEPPQRKVLKEEVISHNEPIYDAED